MCCTCAVLQKDTLQVERLLQKGEQRLKEKLHPDPIIGATLGLNTNLSYASPALKARMHPLGTTADKLVSCSALLPWWLVVSAQPSHAKGVYGFVLCCSCMGHCNPSWSLKGQLMHADATAP